MEVEYKIKAFAKLGDFLNSNLNQATENADFPEELNSQFLELLDNVLIYNQWFSPDNVKNAFREIAESLSESNIRKWLEAYPEIALAREFKNIAVIMAGNIPAVGFHDFLCVLISGNNFLGKLSSDDKYLLPFIAKVLIAIEPRFANKIVFTEGQMKMFDAVIATGSNNSARYFDYYFGKYPNIIRRNRNSVAVLDGTESTKQLQNLGADIFTYFGLGCRNVSKIFVPRNYSFNTFFESIFSYNWVVNNNKYGNNYDYNKTVYLMGRDTSDLLDNNFLLLKREEGYSSPIGVLFYEYYDDLNALSEKLKVDADKIQCLVSEIKILDSTQSFGTSQCPTLSQYADGIDTLKFLFSLNISDRHKV